MNNDGCSGNMWENSSICFFPLNSLYAMLDPTYAKRHSPITASVSEHQPSAWSSYYFDLQILVFLTPAGFYFCFKELSNANMFIIIYGVTRYEMAFPSCILSVKKDALKQTR